MKKLFFALITSFLFVATAWGQCTATETISNFRLGDPTWGGFNYDDKTKEYTTNLNSPIVSFTYEKTAWGATGIEWRIDEKVDGNWVNKFIDNNGSGSATVELSRGTRTFRFVYSGNFAGDFSNIKITQGSYLEIPTDSKDFGVVSLNSDNNKTIKVEYSSIPSNLTVKLAQQDNVFSTSLTGASTNPVTIAYADCSYGSKDITIYFKPTEYGVYTNQLEFSNGTSVSLHGECSTTFDTKAANFKIENVSYTSIKLKWNAVLGASGYRIINQTNGATYTVDANTTSLNATGLKMETNYSFVLYALFNGATSLNATAPVSATTLKSDIELTDCVIYDNPNDYYFVASTEQSIIYNLINDGDADYIKDDNTYTSYITFQARKMKGGAVGSPDMYLLAKVGNVYQEVKYWTAGQAGIGDDYRDYTAQIPHNTTELKFKTGTWNGTLERHVKELKVYKDNILTSTTSSINFEAKYNTPSEPKTFEITYANAAPISYEIAYSNAKGTVLTEDLGFYQVNLDPTAACSEGKQTVSITFTPKDCVKDYSAILTLFNGQYLTITLNGTLQKNEEIVEHIIWNGSVSTDWDNRDNWIKEDGSQLLCADRLSKNLTVILPAPKSTKYKVPVDGITKYPIVPDVSTEDKFFKDRNNLWNGNQVNAGDNATATMIADKIYMENGASLVGVETLNKGTLRYNEVEIDFTPVRCYKNDKGKLRYDWTLVGPVVKPWDEATSGQTRNVYSGDYYLNDLPHVYMRKAEVTNNDGKIEADWNSSFPDLDKGLTHDKAFAIKIPNEYGRDLTIFGVKTEKITAKQYNKYFCGGENVYDAEAPHTYTFRGRFYNDASLPTYTLAEYKKPYVLNNSYPANIDAEKLSEGLSRPVQIYDYKTKSFVTLDEATDKSIISQSSFVVIAKENNETIEIKKDWFETSETGRRSASVDSESFRIELRNDAKSSASEIYVCYDELKEDEKNYSFDAPKIFNKMESSLPDLYTIRYNAKWSGLVIPTISEPIPLGINVNSENQSFTFSLKKTTMSSDVILEDRLTNTQYNLSAGETCQVDDLGKGLNEGRFYLLLSEQEEDPEVSTDIEDATIGNIDIYSQGNSVVVSSTSDIELMQVIVSDMAGRSQVYNVSDNYAQINLPIEAGVYTISVVGDKATRVEKIKLN